MTETMFVGDTHGDLLFWNYLIDEAKRHDQHRLYQVGDFGMWEHTANGSTFIDLLEEHLATADIYLYWHDGNHDNIPWMRNHYGPSNEGHSADDDGFWHVRPHIWYSDRGHRWTWDGVRFLSIGGAYSIDKDWRVEDMATMAKYHGVREKDALWWPQETITDEEMQLCIDGGPCDVVLSHDIPTFIDIAGECARIGKAFYKTEKNTYENRLRLTNIFDAVQPHFWAAGHYHLRYSQRVDACQFEGLGANMADGYASWKPGDAWTIRRFDDIRVELQHRGT